jgi:glutathione S-transferase
MITLYAAYNIPFNAKGLARDFRVMWALEELGLPHTYHWMDAGKGEHKVDPNRSVNPFGKIPSMTDGDIKLFESAAIVHYLYEKAGKLPADPTARTHLLQWMFAALNTVEMPFIELLRWDVFWEGRPGRDVQYPELIEACKARLVDLERALGTKPYLLGDTFGPADILMASTLEYGKHKPEIFAGVPGIRAYLERIKARPAFKSAMDKHLRGPSAKAA